MKRIMTIIVLVVEPTSALAANSIVGKWGSDGEACGFAQTIIGQRSIDSRELRCRFNSVSRTGETVTWKGSCDRAFGRSVPDATVTAGRYDDDLLEKIELRINGGVSYDYVRCR